MYTLSLSVTLLLAISLNQIQVSTSRLTYPSYTLTLEMMSRPELSQEEIANSLAQSVGHLTSRDILSGLSRVLERVGKAEAETSGHALKFQTEASLGGSFRSNVGDQCLADFESYLSHVGRSSWANRMIDATGKPSAGLLSGRFLFLGDFDECRAVEATYSNQTDVQRSFKGQYCLAKYEPKFLSFPPELSTGWAFCIPDSCTEESGLALITSVMSQLNVTELDFQSMTCNSRHVPLTGRAVAVFAIVGVLLIMVLLGTAADLLLVQLPKWRVNEEVIEDLGSIPAIGDDRSDIWRRRSETNSVLLNDTNPRPVLVESEWSLLVKILLTFSAWTNTEKLLSTSQPAGALTCLNGIRVISINWVVLGHTVLFIIRGGENVLAYSAKVLERWSFQAIVNATVSVDTFLVLSGLLVSYTTLKHLKKTEGKANWLMFYVHRYLRLTPVYMIILGIYLATLPYLINGPLYDQKNGFEQDPHCTNTWWANPLYIQNLVPFEPQKYCMGWSWYLAVDMQFYILSPFLLIPLYHRPRLGYLVASLFMLATTIAPLVLSETRNYPSSTFILKIKGDPKPGGQYFYDIYMAPYCRMAPYIVGVLCGHILARTNTRKFKMRRAVALLGWAVAIATALAVLYGLLPYYKGAAMDIHVASVYNALNRTAWALSVAWVIFSCATGYGGMVNTLLSWSLWVPLARLTYVVYLVHIVLLHVWTATSRTPLYASDYTVVILYLATLTASYAIAFLFSVFFEAPGLGLEKLLLKPGKKN